MATEADILAPVCEARGGNVADEATHISMTKHLFQSDTHNGLPAVEGDNFLTPPSIAEVHCDVNNAEKPNQTDAEGEGFGNARNSENNLEAESFESAKNTSFNVKEDAQIEKPGASANAEASYLGQENSTESSVETQKEDIEKFPPVSNEDVKEESVIKSDGSEAKDEENEDEEPRKAAVCENEKSEETMEQNTESQIERETTSFAEEQRVTPHLRGILDENAEDKTIDEGVTEEDSPDVEKEEQGGNLVEHATDDSTVKLPSEEQRLADTHNGLPAVEGENFLKPLSTGDVHCEGNAADVGKVTEERNHTVKSDDQPLEIDANEERSSGEIEQNAEESKGLVKDETKEIEGEELNVQGEMKTEDIPCDLMRDVPEGDECAEIKLDASDTKDEEHSGKEGEKTSLPLPLGMEAAEEPREVTFCENEKSAESTESQVEKTEDPLPVVSDNTKAPDADQEMEEQSVTAHPRAILDVKAEDEAIDTAATKEETRDETKAPDADQEMETNSTEEQSVTTQPRAILDVKAEDEAVDAAARKEETSGETEAPDADQEIETSPTEEQSVTTHPRGILDVKTEDEAVDAAARKEEIRDNTKASDLGEQTERPSLAEASPEDAIDGEPTILVEPKIGAEPPRKVESFDGEDIIDSTLPEKEELQYAAEDHDASGSREDIVTTNIPDGDNGDNSPIEEDGSQKPSPEEGTTGNNTALVELVGENEKNIECTNLVEEEVSNESMQVGDKDIKASALGQDRQTSSLEGQSLTTNPQETMDDAKEDEANDATGAEEETPEEKNIAKTTPYEETKEDLQVQVDRSRQEQDEGLGNDGSSFTEPKTEDATESTSAKEEAQVEKSIGSLQVAPEDVEASASCQETSHLEEQSLIIDTEEVKTVDGTELKEETPDDKSFGSEIPHEHTEENSVTQVDYSQKEDLEKDSENSTEASAKVSNGDEVKDTYKLENKGLDSLQAELEIEENTSFKEEAPLQKPIDSLQPHPEDITASDLSQDTNISIEEKNLYRQEISRDETEEEAADSSEKSLEVKCIARSTPDNYEENSSPIEEDGSEKSSLEDATTGKNNDELPTVAPEAKVGGQIEKDTECPLEESTESSHVEAQDIKAATSGQDKETSSLDDTREERTSDAAGEEETLKDKQNIAESSPYEETGENTVVQVDHSGLEQNEVLEKDSGKASLSEAPTMDTAEKILVEEEAQAQAQAQDHHIESLQVATEVIAARESCQETSSVEEKIPTADSQEITFDHKEQNIIDSADLKEETPEDKSCEATSNEDTRQNSTPEDFPNVEHQEKDIESMSLTEAPTTDTTESTFVKEEARAGDHIDSLQVATDDIKAVAQCQETDTTKEQVLLVNPEDIPRDDTYEKTEVQDIVEDVPRGDDEDNSPTEEDASQKPSFEEAITEDANDHESATTQQAEFSEESSIEAGLFRKEKTTEGTLVDEDGSIEPPQVAAKDIKASSSSEDREAISQEEQILKANPGGFTSEEKTDDPTDMPKETLPDEEAKELENVNTEPTSTELKEEDDDFKDPQLTTAVGVAAPEENDSNPIAVKIPYTKDLDVNEDGVGHPVEDPSCKQEESSATKVPEEHVITGNEDNSEITSLESEISEQKNDRRVVEEERSCGDKTDTKEIGVMDDDSVTIATSETLAETDPRGSTDAENQVPDGEQKAEAETETAPDDAEKQVLTNSSQAVEVNGEEEGSGSSNSVVAEEISPSNVGLEEDSSSIPFQESKREIREEAEKEEAQEQEEEVHVSALTQDSSMEKVENDVQSCVASAVGSDITQTMPELEEPPLSSPDESITETTEYKETEVVEKAIKNEDEDGTESLLDDKKATGEEQEETETELETTMSTSVAVANDFIPISASEPSKEDDSITEREVAEDIGELHSEEAATDESATKTEKNRIDEEKKKTDFSPAALNMTEARNEDVSTLMSEAQEEDFTEKCTKEANDETIDTTEGTVINESTSLEGILVSNRSITDLESKIDDEAPEISETTPTVTEGESTSVGKLNEKRSDSNEIPCETGKQKSEFESETQLESVPQDQSCETISDIEETKTEEKNLEAAAETKSGEVVSVDISEQDKMSYEKEIMDDNISEEKTKDEDVEGHHRGPCEEKVTTEIGEEVNQEKEINTEKVPEPSKEADDRAPNESHPQETEQVKSVEEVTAILDTKDANELDVSHVTCVKTGTQDLNEEINSSSAALLENEDTRTRANDTNNEKERDEGLPTQESNIPEKEAAARELPKELDENTICQAPPTDTVHNITADTEAKKECTTTTVMQPQEEDSTPEHEILPLLQSAQGKECEEQNQKDEFLKSDEVHPDLEDNMMLSARTNEEENKADTWGTPNEDKDTRTDVDYSSQTKDILEVSINNDAPYIPPNGSEDFATKDKSSEEPQIPTANNEIEHAPEDTRVTADSPSAIPNAIAVQSQEMIGTNDKCEVMAETKLQDLPEEFSFRSYEDKVSEKDDPLNLQNERHISDDVQVLIKESSEVSKKENPVEAAADADEIENAPISETLEKATEQHQLERNSENVEEEGVICEDKETIQSQIDSLPILPAEKDPPVQIAGSNRTDVTESEATPPPSKDAKHDEEKDGEEEPDEQKGSELSSEAPVMVDIGDADVKASHKKSHNILSGVGSKVKHSIAKVKKAITGKSSHPKPPSPKKVTT